MDFWILLKTLEIWGACQGKVEIPQCGYGRKRQLGSETMAGLGRSSRCVGAGAHLPCFIPPQAFRLSLMWPDVKRLSPGWHCDVPWRVCTTVETWEGRTPRIKTTKQLMLLTLWFLV